VNREGDLSSNLTLSYSTRDFSAFGVNRTYHQTCLRSIEQRERNVAGCGDYMQISGEVGHVCCVA
jgi:hypothetical protein